MEEKMTPTVLRWLKENAGPDGTITVDRNVLTQAGLPARFVERLSTRLHELEQRGQIVVERKEKLGRLVRYTLRIPQAERERRAPHARSAQDAPVGGSEPGLRGHLDVVLRLKGREGTLAVEELSVAVSGATGGTARTVFPQDAERVKELERTLETYKDQGVRLVENAVRMQETVQELRQKLEKLDQVEAAVEELRARVESLERIVRGLPSGGRSAQPAKVPRIFTDDTP
jgi:hypothetical protein